MDESIQRANGSGAHIRHAAPAHSRNSNGGCKNSSIELLRIIAMFMILMHHFIVHNGYDVLKLPLGPERIFFQLVMQGGGKVGVVIFSSISAWFFLDKEQTIKSNLKRVWIMERELLVLEPHPRGVLPRVRPDRPRHETHGEEHRAIEHGTVVVRHRIRHLPGAAPLPLQGTEGARTRISLGACCNSTDNLGTVEFHSWSAVAIRQRFRLHLRVHPHLRVQVVYEAVHHQTDMAADRHRIRILPSLHRRIRNAVSDGT